MNGEVTRVAEALLFDIFTCGEEERFLFEGLEYPWQALPLLGERLRGRLPPGIEVGEGVSLEGVFFDSPQLLIAPRAIIEPTVVITGGPVFVGPGAHLAAGAYIRGPAYLGERSTVGHACEVKNSILLQGACAAHFNYVGDSILGPGVNLGAGAKLGNLRLDRGPVSVLWRGMRVDTGLKKLGALIGDWCSLGCNAVCNPGTILHPGVHVLPCAVVGGTHVRGTVGRPGSVSRGRGEAL
ncbi:MAG: hypothetical protein AB1503_10795 [Bacillota bacterium]